MVIYKNSRKSKKSWLFSGPIHNVRMLLEAHLEETPPIYTEMLDLDKDDKAQKQWKQVARSLNFLFQVCSMTPF